METVKETRLKLLAVDCLHAMKQQKTFRALSRELSLPAGVLNRYINGSVLPKADRSEQLITFFLKNYLPRLLESSRVEGSRYIVTAQILSQPFLLNVIAFKAVKPFAKKGDIDVVLTAAVDGIPLAMALANFLGVRFAYAKLTQEFAASGHFASKTQDFRPISAPLYLPKSLLKKNDRVLLVDDVIRGGATFDALLSICNQAKATVTGIFALFITSSAHERLRKHYRVGSLSVVED